MLKIYLLLSFLFLFVFKAHSGSYIDKGYYVIDLKNKIEWLKCSAGQRWSDEKKSCLGVAVKLDYFKIEEANNDVIPIAKAIDNTSIWVRAKPSSFSPNKEGLFLLKENFILENYFFFRLRIFSSLTREHRHLL